MGKKALQYPDENFIYYKYINYTEGMAHSSTNTSAFIVMTSVGLNLLPEKISLSKKNMAKVTAKRY